ncbi:MAG: hypothetical protein K2X66_03540, partial [Cyanobacteria bacterium]|nr:hypothetical protein [Cyanobacteriota bacterium]
EHFSKEAVAMNLHNPDAHVLLGKIHQQKRDFRKALYEFRTAYQETPIDEIATEIESCESQMSQPIDS